MKSRFYDRPMQPKLAQFTLTVNQFWRVRDNLSFDVGLRHALTNGHPVNELRAGLTFAFPLGLFGGASHQGKSEDRLRP